MHRAGLHESEGCTLGKTLTDLQKDLDDRKVQRAAKKKKDEEAQGIDDLTASPDDEDKVDEDSTVPIPAAWQQFVQLQGWQSEAVIGAQIASVVHREWHIYLYRLARGLVGGGI